LFLREIPLELIDTPKQDSRFCRDEQWQKFIEKDIAKEGVIYPILVKLLKNGRFLVVEGETRLRAAYAVGLKKIPCYVDENLSDENLIVYRVKLNTIRKNTDFIGLARDMKTLKEKHGFKNAELAKRFGVSRSWITKLLSLNRLDEYDKMLVAKGEMTVTEAYRKTMPNFPEKPFEACGCCGKKAYYEDTRSFRLCSDCQRALEKVKQRKDAKRRLRIS